MALADSRRWRWLGAEFAIIVLGVLSALFVDAWLQEQEDDERAAVYRERLIADLETDVTNISAVMVYYERIRSFGLAVLAEREGGARLDDFTLLFAAFNAAEEWGFTLEAATYTDMQSTGGLALIEDVELRLDLADYHRQAVTRAIVWALPRDFREVARGIIPNALQTAIHERCTAIPVDVIQQSTAREVPRLNFSAATGPMSAMISVGDFCGLDPEEFIVARAAAELRNHPEVARFLRFRISEIRVSIGLFAGQRMMAEDLLAQLRDDG